MAYLVRKININQWPDGENSFFVSKEELNADAVTSDLRTTNNTLSWWRIDDETELEQNNIRIIALSFEELEANFCLKNTPNQGDTAVKEFKQRHYDMCNMNYGLLGKISYFIAKETSQTKKNMILKINVKAAIAKIKELVEKGKADKEMLGDYIKEQLKIN